MHICKFQVFFTTYVRLHSNVAKGITYVATSSNVVSRSLHVMCIGICVCMYVLYVRMYVHILAHIIY